MSSPGRCQEQTVKIKCFDDHRSRATFTLIGPWIVTDEMAHKIPRCIEFISAIHDMEPGDIIATGANHRRLNAFMGGGTVDPERDKPGLSGATPQLTGQYAKA
ncbi:MAG: hypothetical protein ACOYLV_09090 [Rubrivivax sp.]